jgi:hypothetical protein
MAVLGEATAAEIWRPLLAVAPVTQSFTCCVTSTVMYWRFTVTGTLMAKGERKVGRLLNVTPLSVQAPVTTEISTPPENNTVFTKNVIVALLICPAVSPGGSWDRSNWMRPVLAPPMFTTVAAPLLVAGELELM